MYMYIPISRYNLAADGFYGLMIVGASLIGFISVVWLQDQIRNGVGPQWLEQDRREIHRIERKEAEDELQSLQDHIDEAERRSKVQQSAPERVEAAKEVATAQGRRAKCLKQLHHVHKKRFNSKFEALRLKEMELCYDLGVNQRRYVMLLRSARHKVEQTVQNWRAGRIASLLIDYREKVKDDSAYPPGWPSIPDSHFQPPLDWNWAENLNKDQYTIIKVCSGRESEGERGGGGGEGERGGRKGGE